jgi:WD40 repeat protein
MHAHRGAVRGVAFSHDGRMVASAGHEGSFILWDASTGQRLGDPVRHGDSVAAVAFGPENRSLVSASVDGEVGKVMGWNIDVESWLELACRVANRNLSADERRVAFGKGAARRPCPGSR